MKKILLVLMALCSLSVFGQKFSDVTYYVRNTLGYDSIMSVETDKYKAYNKEYNSTVTIIQKAQRGQVQNMDKTYEVNGEYVYVDPEKRIARMGKQPVENYTNVEWLVIIFDFQNSPTIPEKLIPGNWKGYKSMYEGRFIYTSKKAVSGVKHFREICENLDQYE